MNKQLTDLFLDIINYAEAGIHTSFSFITTIGEFFQIRKSLKAVECTISCLEASMRRIFKSYCREVEKQQGDLKKLFVYNTLRNTNVFYLKEYEILLDMLDEYKTYIAAGNFLSDVILLRERLPENFRDYRKEEK